MLVSLLLTLAGLTGTGGILAVAAFFVPSIAAVLKSVFDFLRSPLGTMLGAIVLALFLYGAGYIAGDIHGDREVRVAWRAETAARKAAEAERAAKLSDEMARIAGNALSFDATFSHSIDQKVQAYVAKTPAVECRRATDDDIKRLLSIK